MATFVLVHSPRVGPMTWRLVADYLEQQGHRSVVPSLYNIPEVNTPYWQRHAQAVAQAVTSAGIEQAPILVGHSGAGPLLPAIRQAMGGAVAGYIFVDAGLPKDNKSRLDLFDSSDEVARFRQAAVNGLSPTWSDADLREIIPDNAVRRQFVSELQPMPLAIYEEALPVFAAWPDSGCAYLQFSPVYDGPARQAQALGWPYMSLPAGHFHMLVEPQAVAEALLNLNY